MRKTQCKNQTPLQIVIYMIIRSLCLSLAPPDVLKMGRSVECDQAAAMVDTDCTASCSTAFFLET